MSKAETLLESLTNNPDVHEHTIIDDDSYFVINPDSREIERTSRYKNVLMQFDHNSETYTFELPRYIEGHDMTLCNRVRVHFDNVDGETNEENADVAELNDLAICSDDDSKVLCSWTITRQATQLAGTLNFLVQFECINDAGESVYEWHTDIYTGVEVKKTRINSEQSVIEYSNILEQWYQRLFGTGETVLTNIETAGEEQIESIRTEGETQKKSVELKGAETIATISEAVKTYLNQNGIETTSDEHIRRVAGEVLNSVTNGLVKTVNGVTPDENGDIKIEISSEPNEIESFRIVTEAGLIDPVVTASGYVLIDKDSNVIMM